MRLVIACCSVWGMAALLLGTGLRCGAETAQGANSAWAQRQHYVVLVAVDSLGWDDARRAGAVQMEALARQGVWAPEGMRPGFPSERLPNLYSIVTGLYPGHHGLVADTFLDPERGVRFSATNTGQMSDGAWFKGTPLWSLAESQGMRAGCVAWPGCAAKIAGFRPDYAIEPEKAGDGDARIRQTLAWLRLPATERPHLIVVELPGVERVARQFGPDSPQAAKAVRQVDALIGRLKAELDSTGLPIELVVVSDRGLVRPEGDWVDLDAFTDLKDIETVALRLYGKTEEERQRSYNQLKKAAWQFFVYRRARLPAELHAENCDRLGDPVVIATGPYALQMHGNDGGEAVKPPQMGQDGYDPRLVPAMKATFFAVGPEIFSAKAVSVFDNVNLYPWVAHILGLKSPETDGSLNILSGVLRDNGGDAN